MRLLHCFLFLCLIAVSAVGQSKTEGSHYLFPAFTQGVVLFKTGKEDAKALNYNSLAEQLVFDNNGQMLAVPKEQLARIDTVFIADRKFVVLNDVLVEVLHHPDWDLFVEYKSELKEQGKNVGLGGTSETSAVNTPAAVSLGGMIYNMELPEGMETKEYFYYWLKKDGELKQFVNFRQLRKFYKSQDDLFDSYVKSHGVRFEHPEEIDQLVAHLESR